MSEPCHICGSVTHETWRFCSVKKEFVGKECETRCPNYSEKMLPNGTNCFLRYKKESIEKRLLERFFLCAPEGVEEKKKRYIKKERKELFSMYRELLKKYDESNDEKYRAEKREDLQAMKELLRGDLNDSVHQNKKP